tara:strand:- start:2424 stop:2786 length:363 start_codon:yes stop_codon:yes gene_type:complete
MNDWDKLMEYPDYTTDTGDREKGDLFSKGEERLGDQSGPNAITLEEAFGEIGKRLGKPMLLVKTSQWRGKPGGYYAKAFHSKGVVWEKLIQKLNDNQKAGEHSPRKAWVCGPGRCWTSNK